MDLLQVLYCLPLIYVLIYVVPFLELSPLPLGSILRFLISVPFFEAAGFPQSYLGCPLHLWMKTGLVDLGGCALWTRLYMQNPFLPKLSSQNRKTKSMDREIQLIGSILGSTLRKQTLDPSHLHKVLTRRTFLRSGVPTSTLGPNPNHPPPRHTHTPRHSQTAALLT